MDKSLFDAAVKIAAAICSSGDCIHRPCDHFLSPDCIAMRAIKIVQKINSQIKDEK